jgi:hypothetical protein
MISSGINREHWGSTRTFEIRGVRVQVLDSSLSQTDIPYYQGITNIDFRSARVLVISSNTGRGDEEDDSERDAFSKDVCLKE